MRILLVEDDPSLQAMATLVLSKRGHHEVTLARNGLVALDVLKTAAFELILLDVMMPELDGLETIKRLKADPRTAAIPVIFLTAKNQISEVLHLLELGAIGYVLKPFDPKTLNEQIEEIFSEATSKQPKLGPADKP